MNKKVIRSKRNGILFGLAAFILLLIVALSYTQWKQYAVANAQATQTGEIVQSVDRLLLSLVDAETGQRGFLLTGENRYLEPYTQATQTVPVEVAKLRSLVASQPSELANVERLSRLVDQKMSELGETISLRKTQGVAPALD